MAPRSTSTAAGELLDMRLNSGNTHALSISLLLLPLLLRPTPCHSFIVGSGYSGLGGNGSYNGSHLAVQHNVIVVTIQ